MSDENDEVEMVLAVLQAVNAQLASVNNIDTLIDAAINVVTETTGDSPEDAGPLVEAVVEAVKLAKKIWSLA